VLDGIYIEKEGIPAAVISTTLFAEQTKTMASIHGFLDYPFIEVSHPIASAAKERLRDEANRVAHQVVSLLLHNPN
jgi:hypothetical protein